MAVALVDVAPTRWSPPTGIVGTPMLTLDTSKNPNAVSTGEWEISDRYSSHVNVRAPDPARFVERWLQHIDVLREHEQNGRFFEPFDFGSHGTVTDSFPLTRPDPFAAAGDTDEDDGVITGQREAVAPTVHEVVLHIEVAVQTWVTIADQPAPLSLTKGDMATIERVLEALDSLGRTDLASPHVRGAMSRLATYLRDRASAVAWGATGSVAAHHLIARWEQLREAANQIVRIVG